MVGRRPAVGGNKMGQASTAHYNYAVLNEICRNDRRKRKFAEVCRKCEHMSSGYCNYYEKWCNWVDRTQCV